MVELITIIISILLSNWKKLSNAQLLNLFWYSNNFNENQLQFIHVCVAAKNKAGKDCLNLVY